MTYMQERKAAANAVGDTMAVKAFRILSISGCRYTVTNHTAPDWLTSADTVPGSILDDRWFWREHVMTLEIGESTQTDFSTITRLH